MQISMIPIGGSGGFGDTVKAFAAITKATRDECAEGERFMSQYPPSPSGSRYIRTGKLRQSWSSNVKSGSGKIEGLIGSAGNIAPYNEDVQGDDQEELFKRIGWRNTDDLKSKVEKEYPNRVQAEIDKAFK